MKKELVIMSVVLFALAFCSRILFANFVVSRAGGDHSCLVWVDGPRYYDTALQMAGDTPVFSGDANQDTPEAWDVKGYPFMLSLAFRIFGASPLVGVIASVFWFSVSVVFIVLVGYYLFGRIGGWMAGLIYLFYPALLPTSIFIMPDFFYLSISLAAFLLFVLFVKTGELWSLFVCGVLLGGAALIKEIGLFVPLIGAAYLVPGIFRHFKHTAKKIVVLLLGAALLVGPVCYLTYKNTGQFTLSTKTYTIIKYSPKRLSKFFEGELTPQAQVHITRGNVPKVYAGRYFKFITGTGALNVVGIIGGEKPSFAEKKFFVGKVKAYLKYLRECSPFLAWLQIAGLLYAFCVFIAFLCGIWVMLLQGRITEGVCCVLYFIYIYISAAGFDYTRYYIPLVPMFALVAAYFISYVTLRNYWEGQGP